MSDHYIRAIFKLRPIEFKYIRPCENSKYGIGFLAKDVEEIIPEIIIKNSTGHIKSIDYQRLVVPIIKSIQQQQEDIHKLRSDLSLLTKSVQSHERYINNFNSTLVITGILLSIFIQP